MSSVERILAKVSIRFKPGTQLRKYSVQALIKTLNDGQDELEFALWDAKPDYHFVVLERPEEEEDDES
jgi:hypothetical protein